MKMITKKTALKIAESEIWREWTDHEIVKFQLFEPRLCMPFDVFHAAIEKELGRSVFTHEFGSKHGVVGLKQEFLGEKEAPTLDEILGLIPADKMILVFEEAEQ